MRTKARKNKQYEKCESTRHTGVLQSCANKNPLLLEVERYETKSEVNSDQVRGKSSEQRARYRNRSSPALISDLCHRKFHFYDACFFWFFQQRMKRERITVARKPTVQEKRNAFEVGPKFTTTGPTRTSSVTHPRRRPHTSSSIVFERSLGAVRHDFRRASTAHTFNLQYVHDPWAQQIYRPCFEPSRIYVG